MRPRSRTGRAGPTPALELLDAADDAAIASLEDWQEYEAWSDERDREWWDQQNAEAHAVEPTPLDVLDAAAPFDLDAPDPDSEVAIPSRGESLPWFDRSAYRI